MWPGQQPPGGEQNPQDPNARNPYQQPGYQQPNPYQQPGYTQPGYPQAGPPQANPYQQPTVPQHAVPGQPPGPPVPSGGGDRKRTAVVAAAAALVVLATAGVTGYLVLGDDGEQNSAQGGSSASPAPSAPSAEPSDPAGSAPAPTGNPRDGSAAPKPTVAGWKVVHNPKRGTLFDIPADWEVIGSGVATGFEDEKAGDGTPVVTMSAPGRYKSDWCTYDDDKDGTADSWSLATAGTKGGQGAKGTADAAYTEAGNWAWAAYAQTEPKGTVKVTKAVPFTSASGLTGHVATATALNTKHENKCDTDGKSIAFSFKNAKGDFVSWVMYANTGIKDEVPDATIRKIMSTVRLAEPAS
ncbi:hypothetical protein [Streptomyces rubrolavendulae]|uniref:DUF8017 domain-containing protein n=1 Tax=Streptomyces rubrolavendulae TaxID=285473 RepID=A0A1D8FXA1_9ACTN|nr:hypothetical protein [Streptomyces rubrolavendulae]AOT57802.1 hypothetical protein A4G23_00593 [Streptomyces rubrolavendulae]